MNKELIDRAWACLPKEFKEKVKEIYLNAVVPHPCGYSPKIDLLRYLFGHHNLTSDAEEEEMLIVSRKEIQQFFKSRIKHDERMAYWDLLNIFGSKCLPEEDAYEVNFASIEPKPAEQSMTDSETEHTKDEFATRMQGKFTEQDFTEAKQRTESCMASIPQFELPKQIEAQINKAMESIKAESRKQFGDFGAANADITIPMYRQMMRLGALLALSAGYLESEQADSDRGNYISMTQPNDATKCTLFGREKGERYV